MSGLEQRIARLEALEAIRDLDARYCRTLDDGDWDAAFEATLGQSGVDTPEPPEMDECPAA